jgi:CHAT domain-containing protein
MIKSAPQDASADAQRGLGGELGATKTTDRSHPFYWASFIQSGAWTAMTDKASGS